MANEPKLGAPWPDRAFWHGKKVFLTGHTGFKGSWLALWLKSLGAVVHGLALEPPTQPNLFTLAGVGKTLEHQIGDIRDLKLVTAAMAAFQPDIVMHLAAQPILRLSYDQPVETYATNLMGTVHVMEAARQVKSAKVVLVVTTDKCYENHEQNRPYRETDPMGGFDPYSSSKGCAELAVAAYGRSFFNDGKTALASVRAGNVIGGGDWAQDRLLTDVIAAVGANIKPIIRNPTAIRPWQHVLEPLAGYLCAVEYLWAQPQKKPEAWNFGPEAESEVTVLQVVSEVCRLWGFAEGPELVPDPRQLYEANLLRLDSSKAKAELGWHPRLSLNQALAMTVDWYRAWREGKEMQSVTLAQIEEYMKRTTA